MSCDSGSCRVFPAYSPRFLTLTLHTMSFVTRIGLGAKGPFSLFGASHLHVKDAPFDSRLIGVGAVRTATKRAGGTVHNHGGSPGKRLGVKKFSGELLFCCVPSCELTVP